MQLNVKNIISGASLCLALWSAAAPAQAQGFQLSGVAFSDSSYLSAQDLQAAVRPYMNRDIAFADVQKMMADVQALYIARGIVTATAVIEPQAVADGVLRVTLVEAKLDAVEIDPGPHTSQAFLRERISLKPGARPDFDALARDVRLFEVAYDVRPVFDFSPGARPATARAKVALDAPQRVSWVFSADNRASAAVGRYQLSAAGTVRSVTGVRDTLQTQAVVNRGGYQLSLSYQRPLGLRGGALSLDASFGQSKIVAGGFSVLGVKTTSGTLSARYAAPFAIKENSHWSWAIGASYDRSASASNGVRLQSTRLAEVEAELSYRQRGERRSWSASVGAKAGSARSATPSATDGRYWLISAKASYQQRLGRALLLDANVTGQFAKGQNLPARRAFSVGGPNSLRGYAHSARSGDSGLSGSLQLTCLDPCLSKRSAAVKLSPFAFVDFGYVKPFSAAKKGADQRHRLASVGAGLRASYDQLDAVIFAGKPLISTPSHPSVSPMLYAGLDYRF